MVRAMPTSTATPYGTVVACFDCSFSADHVVSKSSRHDAQQTVVVLMMYLKTGQAHAIIALVLAIASLTEAFLGSPPATTRQFVGLSSRAWASSCGCRARWASTASSAAGGQESLRRPGARRGGSAAVRMGADGEGGVASSALEDKTIKELWARPRKHLMSVGKAGVKPSHVRSLMALVEAHTLVKVKINIPRADFEEVGLQLCGKAKTGGDESLVSEEDGEVLLDISVVTHSESQNILLFAKADFLAGLRDGE